MTGPKTVQFHETSGCKTHHTGLQFLFDPFSYQFKGVHRYTILAVTQQALRYIGLSAHLSPHNSKRFDAQE